MLVRKIALVLAVAVVATALATASASAQIGPNNPSGGTGLRQTTEEGNGAFGPADILSPGPAGWRTWLGVLAAHKSSSHFATRSSDARALLAVARRHAWKR